MIETPLTPRRHPLVVSTGSPFASEAEDYTPPERFNAGAIKGHPWGRRICRVRPAREEFMVYDAMGRNVLSTAPTPELAAHLACRRIERESLPPSTFRPVLDDCSFASRAPDNGSILVHQVLDEDGALLAESEFGREDACKAAATMRLAEMDRKLLTFEDFELITVPVSISRQSLGRKTYGAVFAAGEGGRHQLRALMLAIWKADPEARALQPDHQKFIAEREVDLLKAAGNSNASVCDVDVSFSGGTRSIKVLLHEDRMSARAVMAIAFNQFRDPDEARIQSLRNLRQVG